MESVLRIVLLGRHLRGEVGKAACALARALLKATRKLCATSTSFVGPDCVVIKTPPHSPCNG